MDVEINTQWLFAAHLSWTRSPKYSMHLTCLLKQNKKCKRTEVFLQMALLPVWGWSWWRWCCRRTSSACCGESKSLGSPAEEPQDINHSRSLFRWQDKGTFTPPKPHTANPSVLIAQLLVAQRSSRFQCIIQCVHFVHVCSSSFRVELLLRIHHWVCCQPIIPLRAVNSWKVTVHNGAHIQVIC